MIRNAKNVYVLSTPRTTYMFRVLSTGHLEHLYYGAALYGGSIVMDEELLEDAEALGEKKVFPSGNMISYDAEHPQLTLEDMRLEMSSAGKGDIREPFIEIIHADGGRTSDFLLKKRKYWMEKKDLKPSPVHISTAGKRATESIWL